MKNIKYHLALTDNEYSLIINSLNDLRNDLISQGKYTDTVDDVLLAVVNILQHAPFYIVNALIFRWILFRN